MSYNRYVFKDDKYYSYEGVKNMQNNFKVCYSVKHIDKESNIYGLLVDKKNYFETLQAAFRFSKLIYGSRANGIQVMGRPSIERM